MSAELAQHAPARTETPAEALLAVSAHAGGMLREIRIERGLIAQPVGDHERAARRIVGDVATFVQSRLGEAVEAQHLRDVVAQPFEIPCRNVAVDLDADLVDDHATTSVTSSAATIAKPISTL